LASNPLPFKTHKLLESSGLRHGFFSRQGGVSRGTYESLNAGRGSNDNPDHIIENRKRIAASLTSKTTPLLSLWQCHSTDVLIVDAPLGTARPKADGLVTQTPGLALSVLAADCGPVLFHDPVSGTIGACHAGWRGALAGITDQTINAMESLGANRPDIRAVLGPCISQSAYEVGPKFRDSFCAEDERYDRFFTLNPQHKATFPSQISTGIDRPHFDLKGFITAKLRHAGVTRIDALADCTYSQPERYFSYRYNTHHNVDDYGRNISAIILTE